MVQCVNISIQYSRRFAIVLKFGMCMHYGSAEVVDGIC